MDPVYILTLKNRPDGVFSVMDDYGDHVIPIFESEDDVERYYYMIQELDDHPEMQILEVEEKVIVEACEDRSQKYVIISEDDFMVPPSGIV